jgi:hypothetical protein
VFGCLLRVYSLQQYVYFLLVYWDAGVQGAANPFNISFYDFCDGGMALEIQ